MRQFLILLISIGIAYNANADFDRKLYEKAIQEVWSMNLPQFDPNSDLSDSLYSNKAAVYIARYRSLKASHDESPNNSKAMLTGRKNSNAIIAVGIDRSMVKIFEQSAIDNFNTFTITAPKEIDIYGFTVSSVKPTFGARIIKPDGTIENIDISESLIVTEGKDDSDAGYKITIPGLEPGAVLDYFFYTEYMMEEMSLPGLKFTFFKEYPTKDFMLELAVAPSLALEYSHYNGAPDFSKKWTDGNYNYLSLHLSGMDAVESSMPYFSEERQVPCIKFYILNSTASISSTRAYRYGGVRIYAPYLLFDVAKALKDDKSPKKTLKEATSIMKKWKKNNPQATEREIIDAAFIALNFSCIKNEERHSERQFCKSFSQLLENLSTTLPGRVAITSPRDAAPIDNLASYAEARYFVTVGDSCYFPEQFALSVPGDIPAFFDNEKAYKFDCPPYHDNMQSAAISFSIPRSKSKDNSYETISEVEYKPDSIFDISVSTTYTGSGVAKALLSGAIYHNQYYDELARFLGQKPAKPLDGDELHFTTVMQRKKMTERASVIWNCENPFIYNYKIHSLGCTPDSPTASFLIEAMLPDMTSSAGDDLIISIGKLTGNQREIKGPHRKRDISAIEGSATQFRSTIKFKIPEGYEVIPESVSSLNRNISSPVAVFVAEADIDNGYVIIRTFERYSISVIPASAWTNVLNVLDAAFEFNSATIVLRKSNSGAGQ